VENKTDDVTPAKAGVQSKKAGFPLEFIPHAMRGGNDKYSIRNINYLKNLAQKSTSLFSFLGAGQINDFGSLPGPGYINITIQTEPVFVGLAHSFVWSWT